MKLGIIARSDNTGLGNQTKELVNMLNPNKIMLIDSHSFNKNKQHPEWYDKYNYQHIRGFPNKSDIEQFIKGLDVVLSCETFYSNSFVDIAKKNNVKTVLQYNYEFLDYLRNPSLDLPDCLISPSYWGLEEVLGLFMHKTKVVHIPPPIEPSIFAKVKAYNLSKEHNRILHIGGKAAHMDRNGTNSIIEMLKYSKADYEIVIKSQSDLDINTKDSRLSIDVSNIENREDLYLGYDAMILPRRYAGLCLPMNEALMSALPVFMTNISPNNNVLPKEWLASAEKINRFKARVDVDVYDVDPEKLAKLIDNYMNSKNKIAEKQKAFSIAYDIFSTDVLKDKYINLFNSLK